MTKLNVVSATGSPGLVPRQVNVNIISHYIEASAPGHVVANGHKVRRCAQAGYQCKLFKMTAKLIKGSCREPEGVEQLQKFPVPVATSRNRLPHKLIKGGCQIKNN